MKSSQTSTRRPAVTAVAAALSESDLKRLHPFLVERQFTPRQYVVRHAEPGGSLFVILSGVVEISRSQELGRKVVIARRYTGEVVGEIAAVTGSSRSADVRALTACSLGELAGSQLEQVFARAPSFGIHLLGLLAGRLAESTQQSVNFATCDVPTLVLKALQSLCVARCMTTEKVSIVHPRPTHGELAEMVGSSREVVTRALKLLENAGEIVVKADRILVRT